jgi:Dullard-like phosphatase family protein
MLRSGLLTKTTWTVQGRYPQNPVRSRMTVVLDMDECIIHSVSNKDDPVQMDVSTTEPIESFNLKFNDGENFTVYKRPGLDEFLQACAEEFDTYVFTAGSHDYADSVLDILDPKRTLFKGRFYRSDCICRYRNDVRHYLKDLETVVQERGLGEGLGRMVLVDNNPFSFIYQPDNGIPVSSFYGKHDLPYLIHPAQPRPRRWREQYVLANLLDLLRGLDELDDVRPALRDMFKLRPKLAKVRSETLQNADVDNDSDPIDTAGELLIYRF